MFQWMGRSKRARQILVDMYSGISESQQRKAQNEIKRFQYESRFETQKNSVRG